MHCAMHASSGVGTSPLEYLLHSNYEGAGGRTVVRSTLRVSIEFGVRFSDEVFILPLDSFARKL